MLYSLRSPLYWLQTALLLTIIHTCLSAQSLPYSAIQRQQIDQLRQTLQKTYDSNYSRALSLANQLGRPLEMRLPGGQRMSLQGVDERGNLVYYVTYSATQAGITTHTNSLYAGGSLGLNLSGSSPSVQDKLGIWDGGAVRATHIELVGRVTQMDNASTTTDNEEHPSHVSGIMIASGKNPLVRGMAYKATLKAWDFNNDVTEMAAASASLLVSNHSYGTNAGFYPNPDATSKYAWIWYGDTTISRTYDYRFGVYNSYTKSWDQVAVNAPNYLTVIAAGNAHGYNGPATGAAYIMGNYPNVISTAARDNQTGYDLLPPPAASKNTLVVGAVSNLLDVYNRPTDIKLAYFSSWGPTDDGRIKPDIVGVGVNVLSANSSSDSAYVSLNGTSMASPNVAGSVLLLQEYYTQLHSGSYMRSSTLRGLVLHTADEAGTTPGPDYQFGWGLLNTERAARVLGNLDKSNLLSERTLTQAQHDTIQVIASGRGSLVATICWTDPAGTATSTLNDRTPKLVNDLDLRVSDGTTTTQPWILDPTNPANAATRGDNIRDNIEQVRIDNAVPGKTYTIVITNKATLSGNKQDYALIVSGVGGQAYCTSAPISSADSKINGVTFGSLSQTGVSGCTTYTDFTQQTVTTIQANQTLPLSVTTGTCGASKNVVVKAFADWNADGSFTELGDNIATSGVLNGPGVFTTNITIPQSVTIGQLVRLRIIASETSDPSSVSPCGSYSNGETQDYLVRVIQGYNDVGVTTIVSPGNNFCANTLVAVQVQNFGSQAQTNIPVTVNITDANNNTVSTLTGILPGLPAYGVGQLTLMPTSPLVFTPGQTYTFKATTTLATDQNPANNQTISSFTVAPATTGGLFTAATCGIDTTYYLTNKGTGTASWYDALTGGNLLAIGNGTPYTGRLAGGTFYASLNEFSGRLGPAAKTDFGGGSYGYNFGPYPLISTTVPITLSSARLYIAHAGTLTFTVTTLGGTSVSSVTIPVVATRTLPLSATTTNGQLADDPNDPGAVYPLNLTIPQAGTYAITISYADSAAIFRSNVGVTGFPYRFTTANGQTVVSTKGSLFANATTGSTDTLTTAWYYFYDLQIKSANCPSAQRVAVTPTAGISAAAIITPSGSVSVCQGSSITLQANTGAGLSYQWYKNGAAITSATSSTIQASTAGKYTVQVIGTCAPVASSAVTVSVATAQIPVIAVNSFTLTTNALPSSIQWLLNGVAIAGATSATYVVTQTGRYSVTGNVNGCGTAISTETYLAILATEPTVSDDDLSVYPNPATKQLTVSMTVSASLLQLPVLRLTDLQGRTVRATTLQKDGKNYSTVVDVTDLPDGTFFVVVEDERAQGVRVKRIRKY